MFAEPSARSRRRSCPAKLGTIFAASVALIFSHGPWANPTGPSVASGAASFATAGRTLTVTNSPNAILQWQGFSIGAGEVTRFQQQGATSAVLNRVIGQDPSAILGTLSSNGRVFLVNPNGILFGQGSRVDVAGLVASTLHISDADFLAGRLNFQSGAIAQPLVNQGGLHSASGGHIYLVAPDITNSGLVSSPGGEVILAAGRSVSIVDIGTPNLKVEISAAESRARNLGQIVADSGRIGVYAGLISQQGIVRADSVSKDATGKIVFRASGTTTLEAGSVTSAAGAKGGEIRVLGRQVGLLGDARVDASGDAGGGVVLVGGDLQGKNPDVPNALRTYFGPDATIKADAIVSGDGGKVILWADETTRAHGNISARGGAHGGNGGFVETSGHYLEATRAPDVSAPRGNGGTWLLDPFDITIDATSDQNIANAGPGQFFYEATGSPSTVTVSTLLSALSGGGNVTVSTTGSGTALGNITVNAPISTSQTTAASLTLSATNNIQANADIVLGSNVDLSLYAGNSIATANLGGRSVYLNAQNGAILTGPVTGGSFGVSLYASGAVQPGAITSSGNVTLQSNTGSVTVPNISASGGSIYVYSYEDLSLASTLTTPYGVQLTVAKPGGVLTTLAGSAINGNTSGFGHTTSLYADDMVLGGSVNQGSYGDVRLNTYSGGRDIHIGAGMAAGALNLTPTELSTITASSLTVGDTRGDVTVSGAIAATDLSATLRQLNLYGRGINALGGMTVNGSLYLQGRGNVTTGSLSVGNSLYVSSYGGNVSTGALNAGTGGVFLSANGALQPGDISTSGPVHLTSWYGTVGVPNITTTDNSIYISSFDDVSFASTLNSPYGVTLYVTKPGGVLTMLPGSSVNGNTSNFGYSTSLIVDEMVLGGSINQGTNGSVNLNPYSGRDIHIGAGTVAGALNLTLAELATITSGTLSIGGSYGRASNLTVSGAIAPNDLNTSVHTLYLYGNDITASGGIAVNGSLSLQASNNIATGNLNASSLSVSAYAGNVATGALASSDSASLTASGTLTTGTITAGTGNVFLSAYGAVQPGNISAGGNVRLQSYSGGVSVPNITSTGGPIYVYSFDDVSLASTLNTPAGVQIQVSKPGGVLTMLPGSVINGNTSSLGPTTSLTADEMVLGGIVNQGVNGYVYLNPYSAGRDISIGISTVVGALNLSPNELSTIVASQLGIGNSTYYNGSNLTVSSAIAPGDLNASVQGFSLSGNNVAFGAGVGVSGALSIYAYNNIDANTTSSPLSLSAGGNVTLTAASGRIFTSGSGTTTVSSTSGSVSQSAPLGVNLNGSVVAPDVNVTVSSGDYSFTQRLEGNTVNLAVTAGAINNSNNLANDVTANTLNISAATGIGSSNSPIRTAVNVLNATSGGSGDIAIANVGNLTASVAHSGSGGLFLNTGGHLTANSISVPSGNVTINANGRMAVPNGISTTGTVQLGGYGDITTGNLSGDSLYLSSGGGAITTGTVSAGPGGVSLVARDALQTGAISSAYYVNLTSTAGPASLGGITSTDGSIYANSFADMSLSGVLSSPYGVTLRVTKPGGMLTMLPGSAVNGNSSGFGYITVLTADEMVLGGTINQAGSGYVSLQPYSEGRNVNVGASTVAGALNLTLAELATITTGRLTIGGYLGASKDLTVSSAITMADLGAGLQQLSLYGKNITASAGIAVNGDLYLQASDRVTTGSLSSGGSLSVSTFYGDVATGALSAGSVGLYSGGTLTTGTISVGTGSAVLSANGALQPGDISAGGYVQLNSAYGSISVPNITTTGSSISIYSFDNVSLASTLSSPYGVTLQVTKPGGVLAMLAGSAINGNTSGFGYTTYLSADDMVLAGSVNQSNGSVYLDPYFGRRNINIGSGTVAGALNLTPAELATITTGTLAIGSSNYASSGGNLTVSSPISTTDVHASTLALYGRNVALGASIAVTGDLSIYALNNLDANTTSSTIDLFATGTVTLNSQNGAILRSGTGVTDIAASSTDIDAPLGVDLGGTISSPDVDITFTQGDFQLNTLTANNVTLNVTNGGIVDTNGTALNIIANSLTLNAANGIGDSKAIDTAVSVLTATSGGSKNIQISNTGNLTVNGITHTGTGNVLLTNVGNLTLGGDLTANAVQLSSTSSISQAGGIITAASLATTSVGGAFLSGSNRVGLFSASNSGSGDVVFHSAAPILEVTGISQSGGGAVTLRANDLNLQGQISAGTGLVSIAPFAASGNMFVGNAAGAGLQLSLAELQQIGSPNVELGRSDGTGNLSVSLPATTLTGGLLRLLAGGTVETSGGPYTLQGGTLHLPGTTNVLSGTSVIAQGGTFDAGTVNLSGTFSDMGMTVNVGTLNVLAGGLLAGTGTIVGAVNNSAGTVAPGASPGILTIVGSYSQGSSGLLLMEIGGTTVGTEYDQLNVIGNATLGGTLQTTLINGFVPGPTDTFNLVQTSGTISGTFANVPPLLPTVNPVPVYDVATVTLRTSAPVISGTTPISIVQATLPTPPPPIEPLPMFELLTPMTEPGETQLLRRPPPCS